MRKKEVLVLGDSHAYIFTSKFFKFFFPCYKFTVYPVVGATVSGLENPNSKTNAAGIFKKALEENNKIKNIIFLIGEVDVGFVIWYRAQKYNSSVNDMFYRAITNYRKLLEDDSLDGKNVIIISTPLPTIDDNKIHGEVANMRKDIKASILKRTMLTLKFNIQMKYFAKEKNYNYINLDRVSIKKNKKGARRYLRNFNSTDHHYNHLFYALILFFPLSKRLNSKK